MDNKNWVYLGQWQQPTLSNSFWCYWHKTKAAKELFPNHNLHTIIDPDSKFWMSKEDVKTCEEISRSFNENSTKEFITKLNTLGEELVNKHLAVLEKRDLEHKQYIPQLFDTFRELTGLWSLVVWFGEIAGKHIMEVGNYKEEDLLLYVSEQTKPTWLQEEYQSIKNIGDQINDRVMIDSIEIKNMIAEHVQKYEWYGTHHWIGDKYTYEKCVDEINNYLKKVDEKTTEDKSLSQDWHYLVKLLPEFTYWRTHCAEVAAKVVFESRAKLEECAKSFGLSYEELVLLSDQEILASLEKNELIVSKDEIEERKKGQGCYLEGDVLKVVSGKELQEILAGLESGKNNDVADVKEFKGSVACKGGVVRGKVAVLISPKDFGNFQSGDILVAPETTPDFVPFMQSAIAIITDTGGITSHAAIVSREMRIPCVIGTKIATQVLKTGMEVEVDSEKGIIRILTGV
jgi:phosphohistidine swiveling domain-containing protein